MMAVKEGLKAHVSHSSAALFLDIIATALAIVRAACDSSWSPELMLVCSR